MAESSLPTAVTFFQTGLSRNSLPVKVLKSILDVPDGSVNGISRKSGRTDGRREIVVARMVARAISYDSMATLMATLDTGQNAPHPLSGYKPEIETRTP
jgi:hypothetical protein